MCPIHLRIIHDSPVDLKVIFTYPSIVREVLKCWQCCTRVYVWTLEMFSRKWAEKLSVATIIITLCRLSHTAQLIDRKRTVLSIQQSLSVACHVIQWHFVFKWRRTWQEDASDVLPFIIQPSLNLSNIPLSTRYWEYHQGRGKKNDEAFKLNLKSIHSTIYTNNKRMVCNYHDIQTYIPVISLHKSVSLIRIIVGTL